MTRTKYTVLTILTMCVAFSSTVRAQDVREAARKAQAEREEAIQRARTVEESILNDRSKLLAEVERLEAEEATLDNGFAALENRIRSNQKKLERLEDEWSRKELEFREISGNVRVVARDLETALVQSPITAITPGRIERIRPLLRKGYFPDIDDIKGMTDILFDEIVRSGQVGLVESHYVGRDGQERQGRVLTLGKFTAIYRDGEEVGFLDYSADERRFFALSALPQRSLARQMRAYLNGVTASVPVDMSSGAALRQITHQPSLLDQFRAGGPIVWPILAIALAVLFIVLYKIYFLNKVHGNTDRIMGRVNELAASGDWKSCDELVRSHKGKNWPVVNVIRDGLRGRREDRETLESILHEAILRELPRLERGLAVLAIFGAIAPLLGLLGTVTGMIDTFRVITLFGTGDPKLMSGGISEALVTTELGLAVAIPTMLLHTLLSRRVNSIVGDMEEKAVTLANVIHKEKRQHGSLVASA